MKVLDYKDKNYFIEHLVFQINDPDKIEEWIDLDHEMWTRYIAGKQGFISKEVWVNDFNPGEIQTVICFESLNILSAIDRNEWAEMDLEFHERFSGEFKITRRIHKENHLKLYKARHYQLIDEDDLK